MSKILAKVQKSYQDGHVKLRVEASAHNRHQEASATVAVDLDMEAARTLAANLLLAVEKEAAKIKAKQDREGRRKAWRAREVAAGRLKIISFNHL